MDICYLALPLNSETKNILNAERLARLPKHAIIINVGRGALSDNGALINFLKAKHLGGAALDVSEEYPLSPEDSLWPVQNLIITPYVSARYPERAQHQEEFNERQLMHHLKGGPVENIIDWNTYQ